MRKEERNPVLGLEHSLQTIKTVNPISACAKNGAGFSNLFQGNFFVCNLTDRQGFENITIRLLGRAGD
ncbi:MAG: hypothetical protein SOY99_05990 [Alloprevotella sp.]|nr:hypothetical protein [Alloprevotella sp.]